MRIFVLKPSLSNYSTNQSRRASARLPSRTGGGNTGVVATVLALIVIAIGGWFFMNSRSKAAEEAAMAKLKELGAIVVVNPQTDRVASVTLAGASKAESIDEAVEALADLGAVESLNVTQTAFEDKHAKTVGQLTSITSLTLSNTNVTDAALADIAGLTSMYTLNLVNTQITGAGLDSLAEMGELGVLDLSGSKVAGNLGAISSLSKLGWLKLLGLKITDESLIAVADCPALTKLSIDESAAPAAEFDALRKKNPKLRIDSRAAQANAADVDSQDQSATAESSDDEATSSDVDSTGEGSAEQ